MSSKDTNLFSIFMALASVPLLVMLRAFVMVDLWLWFIVPLGVVKVGMAHMYGITLIGSLVVGASTNSSDDSDDVWKSVFLSVFVSLVFWGIASITHNCM